VRKGLRFKSVVCGLLVCIALCVSGAARAAEPFPAKPIRLLVGFPPGGSADFVARPLGEALAQELGKPIIIDNRPGAGTNIASEIVAQAAPDGYTLLLGHNSSHGINQALYKQLNFDPERDFIPIGKIASFPLVIAVSPSLQVNSLRELIAKAKAEPGKLNFASSGNGSPPHLAGVLFNTLVGVDLVHVPFKGGAPAVLSILAGDTQVIFGTPPVVMPHISAGKLKGLATTTQTRSKVLPEFPSAAEAGVPGYDVEFWYGMFAPKNTPQDVVSKLFAALSKVLNRAQLKAQFQKEGVEAQSSVSPQAFAEFIKRERPRWEKLVKDSGASVD
jgi:tripartite-type tricarboxylate transporter receptor subunit TctC